MKDLQLKIEDSPEQKDKLLKEGEIDQALSELLADISEIEEEREQEALKWSK
jgi:hypothetical protein